MKSFIHNIFTLVVALIGLIGGLLWCIQSNWEYEPLILLLISLIEVIAYFIVPKDDSSSFTKQEFAAVNNISKSNGVSAITNNGNFQITSIINEKKENYEKDLQKSTEEKNLMIDSKKNKISILFIDDDKNFNIVKILKDSGWKNTKTIVDVKTLDDQNIKNAEIIFVDINGVGKLLSLPNEGLDLALMIKQKYNNEKKVIIYSANTMNDIFHDAWNLADSRLVKNALPYQFQNLVEKYSLEFYNN